MVLAVDMEFVGLCGHSDSLHIADDSKEIGYRLQR